MRGAAASNAIIRMAEFNQYSRLHILDWVAERDGAGYRLGHGEGNALQVVARLVAVHAVVVGELEDKVAILVAQTDHRLGPRPAVRSVARRLTAALKLLVPQHAQPQHELSEAGTTRVSSAPVC